MIVPKALPEVGEKVIIKVKKIMPFGAYCNIIEYGNEEAYLPIKEVASGWIKNIHEFLKEGKTEVAKVIYVDKEKRAIDVSIKKVNEKEYKDKLNAYNMEKRYEALFKQVLASTKTESQEQQIRQELSKHFNTFTEAIDSVMEDPSIINSLSIDSNFKTEFVDAIKKNIKPKIYEVTYVVELNTPRAANIETIKKAFLEIEGMGLKVNYMSAPHYRISSEAKDYFIAEEKIKEAEKILGKYFKQDGFTLKKEKD
ncbi:MAG: S1 RNA-binding domain-containing protein [Candidatus Micrarchaeia archaeon]